MPPIRKLALLGCGGFIGSHLLDALLPTGEYDVEGWDLDDRKIAGHLGHPRFTFHRGDIYDSAGWEGALEGADAVIALAAICNPSRYNTNPLEVIDSNFLKAHRVVDACSRLGKWLIQFSTSEVYGRTVASHVPGEEYRRPGLYVLSEDASPLLLGPVANQRWSYACAKQMLERYVYAHHRERGLPFTLIRPFNFIGPRMDFIPGRDGEGLPRVLACFIQALLDGEPMRLVDGGAARRTFTYIGDAIDALRRMLERPDRARNQIFNVGHPGNEVSIRELALRMREVWARVSGDPARALHPLREVAAAEFYGEGYEDSDRRVPDIAKARDLLGWEPRMPLGETLEITLSHYYRAFGAGGA